MGWYLLHTFVYYMSQSLKMSSWINLIVCTLPHICSFIAPLFDIKKAMLAGSKWISLLKKKTSFAKILTSIG